MIDGADGGSYYYKLLPEYSQVYSWEYNNKNTELLLGIYYNRDATGQSAPLTDFLQDMKQAGWGDTNGEINFWMNFPEGPRKNATYFPKIMLSDGKLYDWWYDTDPASREVVAPVFMKTVEGAVRGTEFDYTNPAVVNASGEKTFQLLRLSQVYCWYAEATGRAGEINEQAVKVLNEVRNRADGEKQIDIRRICLLMNWRKQPTMNMVGKWPVIIGAVLRAEPGICSECTGIRIILNSVRKMSLLKWRPEFSGKKQ